MPPRPGERCTCTVASGCLIMQQTEKAEGSCFLRIWVRGRDARHAKTVLGELLRTETPRFHQQYHPLTDSGTMWPTLNGWCAILAGRALQKPVRAMAAWTTPELDRLRAAYRAGGMAGCVREFPERTYAAITCSLRRYNIRAAGRRAEAMAG